MSILNRPRMAVGAAVAATAAMTVLPAAASAKTTITMSGSTSVAPLAAKLARGLREARSTGSRPLPPAPGRLGHRHRRRRPRSCDDRQLVARPAARRPGRPRRSTGSPATASASSPTGPTASGTCRQAQIQAIFSGRVRHWNQVPGVERQRADRHQRPHGRLRYAGRVPEASSSGSASAVLDARASEGVQRPRPAGGPLRPRTRSATSSLAFTEGHQRRSPTRASRASCATRSPASTAACATSDMVTRGNADGRGEEVDPLDHAQQRREARSSRDGVGAAA